MEIRPATLMDLNVCLAMDDAYESEYVWQMEERNNNGAIAISFRQTRLPRVMKVTGSISRDKLAQNFQQGGKLLVADDGQGVRGFIDLVVSEWNQSLWIDNLLVAPGFRRRGMGGRLMRAALEWARQKQLRVVMLDTSTKNYPAICFFQKYGFSFCGFSDRLYPNYDIAMMFALNLR